MRVGVVILPELRWADAADTWRRAEDLGFAHAWTYDHLAWGELRDAPWFSAVPTLTAAALATSTIRLGTLVASPNFRHPVPFAREMVTLDDVAAGRLTVGLGAGGEGWDASVLGHSPWSRAERSARFLEFVELLDRLLCEPSTTYEGRFYRAVEARNFPGCVQQPRVPFAIAATGPRGMRLAAAHAAAWVTNGDRSHTGSPLGVEAGVGVIREQIARLEGACREEGREPTSIDRVVLTGPRLAVPLASREAFREAMRAYAEIGVTDLVIHWPRADGPYAGDASALERIMG